nr:hypothetical protein [Tanacetum cinerariifolium]
MDQNIDSFSFDQIQSPQYPVIHHLSQADVEEVLHDKEKFMQDTQTFLEKFIHFSFEFTPRVLTIAWERIYKIKKYLEKFPDAVIIVLPTEEPKYSLSMGSDDDAFEDIEYVEASLPDSELVSLEEDNVEEEEFNLEDIQDVVLREKLLSINRLIDDIEYLNDNPTPDRMLNSSPLFPIFDESDNSLSISDNSSPEFETFNDQTEDTRSGSTTTHANNTLPEYESFCFKIEPGQERLTSVIMKNISDDSTNDLLMEEVDLFLASDNSIPSGIENFNYESKEDIHFLEELLVDCNDPLRKEDRYIIIMASPQSIFKKA